MENWVYGVLHGLENFLLPLRFQTWPRRNQFKWWMPWNKPRAGLNRIGGLLETLAAEDLQYFCGPRSLTYVNFWTADCFFSIGTTLQIAAGHNNTSRPSKQRPSTRFLTLSRLVAHQHAEYFTQCNYKRTDGRTLSFSRRQTSCSVTETKSAWKMVSLCKAESVMFQKKEWKSKKSNPGNYSTGDWTWGPFWTTQVFSNIMAKIVTPNDFFPKNRL